MAGSKDARRRGGKGKRREKKRKREEKYGSKFCFLCVFFSYA